MAGANHSKSARPAARRATRSTRTTSSQSRRAKATARGTGARALLIPVGAALLAGERLRDGVEGVVSTYSSTKGIGEQLRRFERRGTVARSHLEREVRRARMRLERQLRARRRVISRRRKALSRDLSAQVESAQRQLERTQHWLGDRVDGELVRGIRGRILSRA